MRSSLALLLALTSISLLPGSALATGHLDQEQAATSQGITGVSLAQTFTAGRTGRLDTVSLYAWSSSLNGMTVEIRTTSSGALTTDVLASGTITSSATLAWVDATFATPANVVTGTQYALVFSLGGGAVGLNYPGTYAGGSMWELYLGSWFEDASFDLAFRTYVTAPSVATGGGGVWRSNSALTTSLLPQTLGTYEVSTYPQARAIFDASNCGKPKGDAVACLAGQLLAAKLSIANGSDDSCIDSAVAQADVLLTGVPYIGPNGYSLSKSQRNIAMSVQKTLGSYNTFGCP